MKAVATPLPGVWEIESQVFRDPRGYFFESYHQKRYAEAGLPAEFVQDNHSFSSSGILRGLHAQMRRPQGKLIRVSVGEIFDVAVDIRRGSPHFGRWYGTTLSGDNFKQLYVPPGFAHGFCVLSETAHVQYKVTDYYDASDEITLLWNDPQIGIAWPIQTPRLSAKDSQGLSLKDATPRLPEYVENSPRK